MYSKFTVKDFLFFTLTIMSTPHGNTLPGVNFSHADRKNSLQSNPKKIPRIRIVTSEKELSKSWADHGAYDFPPRERIKARARDDAEIYLSPIDCTSNVTSDADSRDSFGSDTSDTMSTDGDQLATSGRFPKAPDRVLDIIKDWGKGSTCEIRWGFNEKETYTSEGAVSKRTVRRGLVKLTIAYKPKEGSEGPAGLLHLPQSAKIKIWSINEVKINKIKTPSVE